MRILGGDGLHHIAIVRQHLGQLFGAEAVLCCREIAKRTKDERPLVMVYICQAVDELGDERGRVGDKRLMALPRPIRALPALGDLEGSSEPERRAAYLELVQDVVALVIPQTVLAPFEFGQDFAAVGATERLDLKEGASRETALQPLIDSAVFLVGRVAEHGDDNLGARCQLRRQTSRTIGADLIKRIKEDDGAPRQGLKQRADLHGELVVIVLERIELRSDPTVSKLLDQRHEQGAKIRRSCARTDEAIDRMSTKLLGPGNRLGHQRRLAGARGTVGDEGVVRAPFEVSLDGRQIALPVDEDLALLLAKHAVLGAFALKREIGCLLEPLG